MKEILNNIEIINNMGRWECAFIVEEDSKIEDINFKISEVKFEFVFKKEILN